MLRLAWPNGDRATVCQGGVPSFKASVDVRKALL
jgi:hypothetical protein